ncbi:CDGSH iron-sulfur domain-containing protein [Lentibacillus amyloliquefaciens]|uniref:Iron-binding protein n=1 Tax=Lentibacillus amyloliquefaciens TaxID=1472767 RepID=A0A0U3NSL3_9BACI|nr:CDGSH iron-sulfur domain-containing protein [Lentibacillus amyloliquefaciens]ALX49611.1 iron-binding protein [Lentibacillus amyloliquefaciens]
MSEKATIKVNDNGPYLVKGEVEMVDAEGNVFETKKAFSICRCGHSSNKPFCDGTHRKVGFESEVRAD